jgi:hypothetical protein
LLRTYHHRFGLRLAPPTVLSVIFAAGTTHLMAAVNDRTQKLKKDSVEMAKECVDFLDRVAESWPVARHWQAIMTRLMNEYHRPAARDITQSNELRAESTGIAPQPPLETASVDHEYTTPLGEVGSAPQVPQNHPEHVSPLSPSQLLTSAPTEDTFCQERDPFSFLNRCGAPKSPVQ